MEIKLINKKQDKITFLVKEINETIANSIRRSLQEIPVLAIDTVEFIKNDSALFDEILAHRIGLLPIKIEKLSLQEECSCKGKGCSKCTVSFKLEAKGACTVYSSDLKGKGEVVHDKTPLVFLAPNQELQLNAYARLGTGKEHTKFAPGILYYKPSVTITANKNCDSCLDCVKACPLNILEVKDNKIVVQNIEECDVCESCLEACNKKGKNALEIKKNDGELIFILESWGQMPPKEIFVESIKVMNDNLKQVEKKIEKL